MHMASQQQKQQQQHSRSAAAEVDEMFMQPASQFFPSNAPWALTYDDVSLSTLYSEVLPRQADPRTRLGPGLELPCPIVSADMDTVTGPGMAAALAAVGGLGLIHYNMTEAAQVAAVAQVKRTLPGLAPVAHVGAGGAEAADAADGLGLEDRCPGYYSRTAQLSADGAAGALSPAQIRVWEVLEGAGSPAEAQGAQRHRELVVSTAEAVYRWDGQGGARRYLADVGAMWAAGLASSAIAVVEAATLRLLGVVAREAVAQAQAQTPAYDAQGRLLCGVAVSLPSDASGALDVARLTAHVGRLVAAGADVVTVGTAHGHSARVGQAVAAIRAAFGALPIIAGNVTTAKGALFLVEAGATAVKVGQGPGSICSTRVVAGVGVPQLAALYAVALVCRQRGVAVLADGGITKSGDIVKALTLADAVVCGGLLAGCPEAPGEAVVYRGCRYKAYRGMGSLPAMRAGSAARYGYDGTAAKMTAEGVEALKEAAAPVRDVVFSLVGGLRSGMGYLGARDLAELRANARYVRVSPAGVKESYPHDVHLPSA
eukprot:m51a1_g7384 putative inosine-5 -monophosphate dehydrogenase (542) ;mRNA; f:113530-115155